MILILSIYKNNDNYGYENFPGANIVISAGPTPGHPKYINMLIIPNII